MKNEKAQTAHYNVELQWQAGSMYAGPTKLPKQSPIEPYATDAWSATILGGALWVSGFVCGGVFVLSLIKLG